MKCNRCRREIAKDEDEVCWYCNASLCVDCWERYGHCGHSRADEINTSARIFHEQSEVKE